LEHRGSYWLKERARKGFKIQLQPDEKDAVLRHLHGMNGGARLNGASAKKDKESRGF
jgi:hypothetical protein